MRAVAPPTCQPGPTLQPGPASRPPLPGFLRDSYAAAPAAVSPPGAALDGAAPEPRALRAAILDYRAAVLSAGGSSVITPMLTNLYGPGGNYAIMLLPGLMVPQGARLLSQAWLGREPRADELARLAQLASQQGPQAVIAEISSRGLYARLKRTDGSPAAIAAIRAQVAAMLVWQPGDAKGTADTVVPAIPPGPAFDPLRAPAGPATHGTPNKDRAHSAEAGRKLRAAIRSYDLAVDELAARTSNSLILALSGKLNSNQVSILPGLLLPHGATMLMLAWLGREATGQELARWQGWQATRDGQQALSMILDDIERTGLAARLPETDGSARALAALRQEVGAKLTWR